MKLSIGKPTDEKKVEPVAEVQEPLAPTESKPKSGLAALIAKGKEKPAQESVAEPAMEEAPTKPQSKLGSLLAKAPEAKEKQEQNKIELADKDEKYVLLAEATDKLPQEVLDNYAAKMQHIISSMGTPELQNALHNVLRYCEEHPHLREIIRAHDVQTIVRASRQSYGLVLHSKTTNSNTTKQKSAEAKEILAELADLDFGGI